MGTTRRSRMKEHSFEHCGPTQPKFKQPGSPIATTARPMFDQVAQSSKRFPKDVGVVKEGDKYAFCFESHTNGKAGK